MRRENARQLMTQVLTWTLRPNVLPMTTAILPRGPYLSSYEAVRRKAAGSWKKLIQSDSLYRFPFRLNWFVLLTNSKALSSLASDPKYKVITASALTRKSSMLEPPFCAELLNVDPARMLFKRIKSSEETTSFPKQFRNLLRRSQIT